MFLGSRRDHHGLGMIESDGFFAQDVFPCLSCAHRPLHVLRMRSCDINRRDVGIREQRIITTMRLGHPKLAGETIRIGLSAAAHGGQTAVL